MCAQIVVKLLVITIFKAFQMYFAFHLNYFGP